MERISRRRFLVASAAAAGSAALAPTFLREALASPARAGSSAYGPLLPPDSNDLMLPSRFRSRLLARGLQTVPGTNYTLPMFPDGQAVFRMGDGGWILVTNAETLAPSGGGASAMRFGPDGAVRSAYRILDGTDVNCAGGPTPWGTWLSCEEAEQGLVWECDPAGVLPAEPRPALGSFKHEAAAVDPLGGRIYLTEDENDGGFYRFTPAGYPSLTTGVLEVAVVAPGGNVTWRRVRDPSTVETGVPTRRQVAGMTHFRNGEGIWYARGVAYFTTKSDRRVWAYDIDRERIDVLYDRATAHGAALDAVDNVTVTPGGDVYVCEDGGNMEIGLISEERTVSPFLRFVGPDHQSSEVCGVCFDPSGTRMYLTSQRAFPPVPGGADQVVPVVGNRGAGAVYEVTGPFRLPRGGMTPDFVYGPPAGKVRPQGPLNPGPDTAAPEVGLRVARRVSRAALLRRGLGLRLRVPEGGRVAIELRTAGLSRRRGRGGSTARPKSVRLAKRRTRAERGTSVSLRLKFDPGGRARLRRRPSSLRARLIVSVVDGAGNRRILARVVRIGRGRRR